MILCHTILLRCTSSTSWLNWLRWATVRRSYLPCSSWFLPRVWLLSLSNVADIHMLWGSEKGHGLWPSHLVFYTRWEPWNNQQHCTVVQHSTSLVCLVKCCPKDVRGKVPKTARVPRLDRKLIGVLCLLFLKSVFQPLLWVLSVWDGHNCWRRRREMGSSALWRKVVFGSHYCAGAVVRWLFWACCLVSFALCVHIRTGIWEEFRACFDLLSTWGCASAMMKAGGGRERCLIP